jgi:hypothetical protein
MIRDDAEIQANLADIDTAMETKATAEGVLSAKGSAVGSRIKNLLAVYDFTDLVPDFLDNELETSYLDRIRDAVQPIVLEAFRRKAGDSDA